MDVPEQQRLRTLSGRRVIVVVAIVVLGLAAGLLIAHVRSGDPGSAKLNPDSQTNDRRANSQIQHRASRLVAALSAGDSSTLNALAFDGEARQNVPALISAFGHRNDTVALLEVDEFGGRDGVLTVSAPCKGAPPQQFIVGFTWKRTSWLSSNWFAVIKAVGTVGLPEPGCAAPN